MKIFTFSFKSLLIAAGLIVGSANAWSYTETYNFTEHLGNFTYTGRGTNYSTGAYSYFVSDSWLNGRFTFEDGTTSGVHRNYWTVRTFTTNKTSVTGLNNTNSTARLFGIHDLQDGDVIVITMPAASNDKILAVSTNLQKEGGAAVAANEQIISGQRYVVKNSNTIELKGNQYCCIEKIQITIEGVRGAVLDCKRNETSSAFETAIDAESFASAADVYAFHTNWQIENAGSNDITKVIRNANIADETDWDGARIWSGEKYTGAPDEYYLDQYQATINSSQTIYGVPAGKYTLKAATRANADIVNAWLYVNDGTGDIAKVDINRNGNTGGTLGNGWSWSEMTFVITETKNLLIGFYANASATGIWAGCDTWKMTLVATPKTPQSSANLDGWKTFYNADSNYEVDANTTIYIATTPTSGAENVVLTPVSGKIVPANTPVILKTEAGDWKMNLTPTSSNPVDPSEFDANDLQVKTADPVVGTPYILAYTTANGLGFYPYSSDLDAGDVYITVSPTAKKLSLVVDGEASEVVAPEVAETEEEEVLYNMAGIQVDKNFKGFVINQKGVKRFNK